MSQRVVSNRTKRQESTKMNSTNLLLKFSEQMTVINFKIKCVFLNNSNFPTSNANGIAWITIQVLSKPRPHAGNEKCLMSYVTLYYVDSYLMQIIHKYCHDSRNKPTGVQITLKYWLISCYTTELRKLNMLGCEGLSRANWHTGWCEIICFCCVN